MDSNIFKPKILIVDDIPENLFALEKILSKLDAQIIRASSGNEALALILDNEFALIILDVQMPEMDGYEVAEILKSNEKTENIPIIFVTA
ncbi:MAG: response regulator, partial [Desulfamplus sp.]|nr:response regulator [Desulfamplus sp.]